MEVQIEKKNETSVGEIVSKQTEPSRVTVVTSENFDSYVNDKMGIKPETPEEKAKVELEKVEKEKAARKAADDDVESETGVSEHLPKDKKGKLNERFSELTAARKAAEEKAVAAEAKARSEREARETAESERNALKAKYEPVKADPDPEPQPSQFADVGEFTKALKEWTSDNTRREDARKAQEERATKERESIGKAWSERQAAYKAANPEYEKTISESTVKVSDVVRDAIIESEAGPQILEHLAKNPDVADKIGQMTVGRALKEIGKLEGKFGSPDKEAKAEVRNAVAEISKAPAPITPLRGANAPVNNLKGTDEFHGTFEEYKAKRAAGKIR